MRKKTVSFESSNRKTTRICFSFFFLFILPLYIFGQFALAQDKSEHGSQPFKIKGKEVKDYLVEKYKFRKDEVRSEIYETPNGPKGKLDLGLGGEIISKAEIVGEGKQERARAITRAFLEEESDLFGIANLDEIREIGIHNYRGHDGEYIMISYRRFIGNLEMGEMDIRLQVNPRDKITWVNAEIVPASPELYETVKKKTIDKDEAINIIHQDLQSNKIDPERIKKLNITKIAIQSEPYVIWTADVMLFGGRWGYSINAFSGEIIKKINDIRR